MMEEVRILVVDDDPDILVAAKLLLRRHFAEVDTTTLPDQIPKLFDSHRFDAILLDMNFALGERSGEEGLRWLGNILEIDPHASVILITGYSDLETAVGAIKMGACDFVAKPWQNERLIATVSSAIELHRSKIEAATFKGRNRELVATTDRPTDLVGSSEVMQRVFAMISRAAPTDADVLILGQNGTGKEVVAREIHQQSSRSGEVFVSIDLGAVSESLFESELFGHKKGAFTDAKDNRIGRIQAANGGTLFLDEIGNLPLHLQAKLLTVIERREVRPVGGNKAVPFDVRLICATNMPISSLGDEDVFRQDLLYRINTVEINVPPLKERLDDLPALLEHFIGINSKKYNLPRKRISAGALARLQEYHWPGNIRELRHAVERAIIMSGGEALEIEDFSFAPGKPRKTGEAAGEVEFESFNLEDVERKVVEKVLTRHSGNISHAAKELGITRTSLYRRIEKHGL
jgi:DNA-binding NtrC family response regulator